MSGLIRWDKGRTTIDQLLSERSLERVPANEAHAEQLLESARKHLRSAKLIAATDPELSFSAAYDAARKALTATLATQGLRPTSQGGHLSVINAAIAQFDPPMGSLIKRADWMRRTRNDQEYPKPDSLRLDAEDLDDAFEAAAEIIEMSAGLLIALPPFGK